MKRNLSNTDRTLRILLAALFGYLYFAGIVTGAPGILLVVIGAIFLLTGLLAYCPIYSLLKLSTFKA